MSTPEFDIVVVGAGLIGLATGRELLRRYPDRRLAILEKEAVIASHQSGRNSGVIHSGIYYSPGSLKAQLCVEGAGLLTTYCEQRGIPYKRLGKLIVATKEAEMPRLDELFRRGQTNGVAGLTMVQAEDIPDVEPHARGLRAIHSPNTGIIDYRDVALSLVKDIQDAGGSVTTGMAVSGLNRANGNWALRTTTGTVTARSLITCAGLYSDVLARMTGASPDPQIVPFRGDYWRVRPGRQTLVRGLIYPVPDPSFPFLGVHFTTRMDGDLWLGPNAVLAFAREGYRLSTVRVRELLAMLRWPGLYRMSRRYWRTGLSEMYRAVSHRALHAELQRYVPDLQPEDILPGPSGVRAQALSRSGALVDDFVFSQEEGVLHVRNAPSPAATSCLAIARRIVDQFAAIVPTP
jgi:(S)-2-hydroxyglutarate dehydrogenase